MLLVLGLLVPLGIFAALALCAIRGEPLFLDVAAMNVVHAWAGPHLDTAILWVSHLGYSRGVMPFSMLLVIALLLRRHWREGAFSLAALGGSLWLNGQLKALFVRPRPDLWEPLWPYSGYSFPSGHAAATASLTLVLALLAWRTRWRVPVLVFMVPFTLLVGVSRSYLGVHYPSDVLAGWAFGGAWAVSCYLVAFRRQDPWQGMAASTS
jgi:undecaprenyl-diphosphatase